MRLATYVRSHSPRWTDRGFRPAATFQRRRDNSDPGDCSALWLQCRL